jgi:hypothetical protein
MPTRKQKQQRTLQEIIESFGRNGGKRYEKLASDLDKAIDAHIQPLCADAYALCLEIEKLPSGEHQTKLSFMASNLRAGLEKWRDTHGITQRN